MTHFVVFANGTLLRLTGRDEPAAVRYAADHRDLGARLHRVRGGTEIESHLQANGWRPINALPAPVAERIGFNIWDDYPDDGHVPAGGRQETHGRIETRAALTEADRAGIIDLVFAHLQTVDLPGVEIKKGDESVSFAHLTHARRERLVRELKAAGLKHNNVPIDFYSES